MITLDHEVLCSDEQMEFIIEGMRNPMNSWEKSDSHPGCFYYNGDERDCLICGNAPNKCYSRPYYILGKNDMELMNKLAKAGKDHRKYMRMIPVMIRITAPLYWWKEFDTYKIGTVANSTSTMHKITAKEFTMKDFSTDMLTIRSLSVLESIIKLLNHYRYLYLKGGDDVFTDILGTTTTTYEKHSKKVWYQLIQMLPDSYNQTRNVFFNYEVLANIYQGRRNHKLNEWHVVCDWIERLPYSHLITGKEPNDLKTDRPLTGKDYLGVAAPTNSYVATDPIQWETVDNFPKAKLAPADFENIPDDIEDQEKSIDEGFVRDVIKHSAERLTEVTDMKVLDFLKESDNNTPTDKLFLSPVATQIMNNEIDKSHDDALDSQVAANHIHTYSHTYSATAIPSDKPRKHLDPYTMDMLSLHPWHDAEEIRILEARLNGETPESAIRSMTRSEVNRNYRLVGSDPIANKDLEDWKNSKKEDSDNDKPQGDCNC